MNDQYENNISHEEEISEAGWGAKSSSLFLHLILSPSMLCMWAFFISKPSWLTGTKFLSSFVGFRTRWANKRKILTWLLSVFHPIFFRPLLSEFFYLFRCVHRLSIHRSVRLSVFLRGNQVKMSKNNKIWIGNCSLITNLQNTYK